MKLSTSIAAISLALSSSYIAAEQRLEEIIVTAQKRAESIQDVPVSIVVHTAQSLKDAGISSITELQAVTPGFVLRDGGSQANPYIRGVGARAITPGNEVPTAVYLDGVYMTGKTGILLSTFPDVESVEVLRGPQGTLFGRNATAGAILTNTKMPQQDFTGDIGLTYGNEEQAATLWMTGGLTETISASLSAFGRYEDDYIENLNPTNGEGSEVGKQHNEGIRLKFLWEPTDNFSALLSGEYIDSEDQSPMSQQPISSPLTIAEGLGSSLNLRSERVYGGEIEPLVSYRGQGAALTLNWHLENTDFKSITAYREDGAGVQFDLDGSELPLFFFETELNSQVVQQEFNFSSNTDGPFSWFAGLYYIKYEDGYDKLDQNVGLTVPYNPAQLGAAVTGINGPFHIEQSSHITVESQAIFGEVAYKFNDATKLTLGLRYTDEESTFEGDSVTEAFVGTGAGVFSMGKTTITDLCSAQKAAFDGGNLDAVNCKGLAKGFEELTWRVVLDHRFNDDLMGYVSYNRGFKSGVFNISSITPAVLLPTDPEIIDAFEIGFKGTFLDGSLNLNGSAYYYDYTDLQVAIVDPATNTQFAINAAEATISGMELEATYLASDNLRFSIGLASFFESEYESFEGCVLNAPNGAGNFVVNGDCTNEDLPSTPDLTYTLSGVYTIPFESGARVELAGMYHFMDELNITIVGDYPDQAVEVAGVGAVPVSAGRSDFTTQESTEMLNLSATWYSESDAVSIQLWGKNMLNDEAWGNVTTSPFGFTGQYNRERSYGLTVGYRW